MILSQFLTLIKNNNIRIKPGLDQEFLQILNTFGYDTPEAEDAINQIIAPAFKTKIRQVVKKHFKKQAKQITLLCQELFDCFDQRIYIRPKDLLLLIQSFMNNNSEMIEQIVGGYGLKEEFPKEYEKSKAIISQIIFQLNLKNKDNKNWDKIYQFIEESERKYSQTKLSLQSSDIKISSIQQLKGMLNKHHLLIKEYKINEVFEVVANLELHSKISQDIIKESTYSKYLDDINRILMFIVPMKSEKDYKTQVKCISQQLQKQFCFQKKDILKLIQFYYRGKQEQFYQLTVYYGVNEQHQFLTLKDQLFSLISPINIKYRVYQIEKILAYSQSLLLKKQQQKSDICIDSIQRHKPDYKKGLLSLKQTYSIQKSMKEHHFIQIITSYYSGNFKQFQDILNEYGIIEQKPDSVEKLKSLMDGYISHLSRKEERQRQINNILSFLTTANYKKLQEPPQPIQKICEFDQLKGQQTQNAKSNILNRSSLSSIRFTAIDIQALEVIGDALEETIPKSISNQLEKIKTEDINLISHNHLNGETVQKFKIQNSAKEQILDCKEDNFSEAKEDKHSFNDPMMSNIRSQINNSDQFKKLNYGYESQSVAYSLIKRINTSEKEKRKNNMAESRNRCEYTEIKTQKNIQISNSDLRYKEQQQAQKIKTWAKDTSLDINQNRQQSEILDLQNSKLQNEIEIEISRNYISNPFEPSYPSQTNYTDIKVMIIFYSEEIISEVKIIKVKNNKKRLLGTINKIVTALSNVSWIGFQISKTNMQYCSLQVTFQPGFFSNSKVSTYSLYLKQYENTCIFPISIIKDKNVNLQKLKNVSLFESIPFILKKSDRSRRYSEAQIFPWLKSMLEMYCFQDFNHEEYLQYFRKIYILKEQPIIHSKYFLYFFKAVFGSNAENLFNLFKLQDKMSFYSSYRKTIFQRYERCNNIINFYQKIQLFNKLKWNRYNWSDRQVFTKQCIAQQPKEQIYSILVVIANQQPQLLIRMNEQIIKQIKINQFMNASHYLSLSMIYLPLSIVTKNQGEISQIIIRFIEDLTDICEAKQMPRDCKITIEREDIQKLLICRNYFAKKILRVKDQFIPQFYAKCKKFLNISGGKINFVDQIISYLRLKSETILKGDNYLKMLLALLSEPRNQMDAQQIQIFEKYCQIQEYHLKDMIQITLSDQLSEREARQLQKLIKQVLINNVNNNNIQISEILLLLEKEYQIHLQNQEKVQFLDRMFSICTSKIQFMTFQKQSFGINAISVRKYSEVIFKFKTQKFKRQYQSIIHNQLKSIYESIIIATFKNVYPKDVKQNEEKRQFWMASLLSLKQLKFNIEQIGKII